MSTEGSPRQFLNATPALMSGGVFGAVLLGWMVVTVFAPGFGSMVAVFGSPLFAFAVILRLLTLPPAQAQAASPKRSLADVLTDTHLLERVIERNGDGCHWCGAKTALHLHPVLPIGSRQDMLEQRLVALCSSCQESGGRRASAANRTD